MDVKRIGIIGGGPSGIVALNEFLHTSKSGKSGITSFNKHENKFPEECAFEEIVVFEQNNDTGGVWLYSEKTDPAFPKAEKYSLPENVREHLRAPSYEELKDSSKTKPFVREILKSENAALSKNLWNKSAVYDHLFTNIPNRLMRFSSGFDIQVPNTDEASNIYYPFVSHSQVLEYLRKYVEFYGLKKYIRFNSTVEKVYKIGNKWIVTVVEIDILNNTEKWYIEEFDAVICAVGRFNIPFIPDIENLNEFRKLYPDVVSHTKSFRNSKKFENKKVLLVGSSISAIDLLQYFIPKCKEVWLSTNSSTSNISNTGDDWISNILRDESLSINKCARIKRFHSDGGIEFEDGRIIGDFDKVLFATGYHLTYPFLDIPENEGKNYIKIDSGNDNQPNYAKTKVDNVYLYTFTINEPTLAHTGVCTNPLFFLVAEVNSIAMAGIWSNAKTLPTVEEQREWCNNRLRGKTSGFQVFDENSIIPYIRQIYEYAPENRLDVLEILKPDEILQSREVLRDLFYKFANGELLEEEH